jgi:two-component system, OmpR family, phosphate regulon response regulator PhoB
VCRRLKTDLDTRHVPVILLSARTQNAAVERGFESGTDRYLAKPFLNDELLKTIATVLLEKKTTGSGR